MNLCKNCKYWAKRKPESYRSGYENLFGECDSDIYTYTGSGNARPPELFSYWDYEGYNAGFEAHPNFGCVGWEAKE